MIFVLVHGAWHDGSAWHNTVKRLEELGHTAYAPTIAGHGPGSDKTVSHADCVQSITDFIVENDISNCILAGHSFAGTIIMKVAEQIPERLRRLVFQNAFVPADGESLNDNVPPSYQELFENLAENSPDRTMMLPFEIWREAFIQDADLDTAQEAYETLTPEAYEWFATSLDLKKFYTLTIPRSYINCTEDASLPQNEWGWHPRMSSRLGLFRLVQMPGSHEVVFTNPAGLADALVRAGRD